MPYWPCARCVRIDSEIRRILSAKESPDEQAANTSIGSGYGGWLRMDGGAAARPAPRHREDSSHRHLSRCKRSGRLPLARELGRPKGEGLGVRAERIYPEL